MSVRSTIMAGMVTAHSGSRKNGGTTRIAEIAITKYWMQPSSSSIPKLDACSRRNIGSHSGVRPPMTCSAPQVMQIAVAALQTRWISPPSRPRLSTSTTSETAAKTMVTVTKAGKLSRAIA